MFAFTWMAGKQDTTVNSGCGPFCFRIQGENNHVIGDLIPKPGETPKFEQLYIYDPPNEIQNRINVVSTSTGNASSSSTKQIDRQLTTDLKNMLDIDNPLVKQYRLAGHRLSSGESNVKLRLIGRRHHDGRQHNLPTANEVAALIIGDFDYMPNERDIIVHKKNGKMKQISELHVSYLPLQYPLLFPYAEDSYRTDIYHQGITDQTPDDKKKYVTMRECYLDAMAICKWYGYPDLFITFRCNPKWPEITRYLKRKGLKSEDRSDVTSHVFKMKLDQLINDIKEMCIFGRVKAEDKLRLPADIDRCIFAEIPDKELDPKLYQMVKEFMMHGPCGPEHRSFPCMVENKCSKNFLKKFNENTFIDESGYPIYKKTDNGRTVRKQGADLNAGFVVPYNPTLLKTYQAHINVEWCNQFGSIKYLFKYITKCPDRVTAAVEDEETDKIKDYYDCRYLSSCEAAWRIFKFDIHHRSPAVERLPFHLPNQQSVVFDPTKSIDFQLEKVSANTSKFLAWMECNQTNKEARKLYAEFPKYYVWNKTDNIWTKRKKGKSIGRIHHVPPSWDELWYLQDDKEYIDGIIEASDWGMRDYLRNYFVMLIISGSMSRPEIVWKKTWHLLAQDVLHLERIKHNHPDLQLTDTQRYNICLTYIKNKLLSCSKRIRNIVNMSYPDSEFTMKGYNCLIYDELDYKISDLILQHRALYASLTNEKKVIYETIVDDDENNKGGMFFIYGYGGTGKTFLYKTLTAALRSKRQIVLNIASSGIASLLLDGRRTPHSRFVIPINVVEDSMCTITADSDLADLIRETKLIIWDEAPMINRLAFEAFDRTLRDIATGKIGGKNDGHAEVEFPKEILIPDSDDHVGSVIKEVYDDWEKNMFDPTYFQDRAILAPTHEQVNKANNRMMVMIPGRENVHYSSDTVTDVDINFNYRLKNDEATYQRLVDKAFQKQIGRNLKVYVDDLVIKSFTEQEVIRDIEETFRTLRKINMKLNPKKCTFGMREGTFLGYKMNAGGLKVCSDKVEAVLGLPSLKYLKDVQKLNGKLASLNRFLYKSAKKSLPFFKTLKKCINKSDFQWTAKAETTVKQMKKSIVELPMLTTPKEKEELIIYLAVAKEAIGAVLMTERDGKQMPIYFVSRALQGPKTNYTPMEKLILALDTPMEDKEAFLNPWILFTDGSSCIDGSGAGRIITNLEGREFTYALRFREENKKAYALSKIASTSFAHLSKHVLIEELKEKSIDEKEVLMVVKEEGRTWMTLIHEYLKKEILPDENRKARVIRRMARRYAITNGVMYKSSFLGPWLRYVGPLQANYILREIHEGSCSMHTGPRSVVAKSMRLRFGLPVEIISDNEKRFRDNPFKDWCEKLCIRQCFASVKRPQANGLMERANRSLCEGIKVRLDERSKICIEEISHVLWAHRTMIKSSNGETPFSLTYGTEAVIPIEIGMLTLRIAEVDMIKSYEDLEIDLDLLEEKREQAAIQEAKSYDGKIL
nr:uncharacterized protein [Tanacetum cinerariifolium]